jgi:hypothetical protein
MTPLTEQLFIAPGIDQSANSHAIAFALILSTSDMTKATEGRVVVVLQLEQQQQQQQQQRRPAAASCLMALEEEEDQVSSLCSLPSPSLPFDRRFCFCHATSGSTPRK